MRKLLFLLACFFLASIGLVSAQSISGKVISDEDGQPIAGATVVVKGTNVGTNTNGDGLFTVNLRGNAKTLVITFLGMEKLEVQAVNNMVIKMKNDRLMIDEVIVTAMGIKRSQKSLGYAANSVSSEEISANGNRSALNALQGKIAGVEISSASGAPGASTRVIMRGITTLRSDNQPLYIIDGVPVNNGVVNNTSINGGLDFGNRANDINPDDIESMTILKGGSATALYGSRASSGVIIITTKNGSKSNNKAKVEINSTTSFDSPLRLPYMQNEFGQGWYNRTTSETGDLQENGSWGPRFDGETRVWGFVLDNQQQIKPYVSLENNIKDFFDVGLTSNNSVSISNGDENKSFYVSLGNVYSDGIMPTSSDSYKRQTAAVRGSTKFMNIFTASASLNYIHKSSNFVQTGQDQSVLDGLWQNARDMSVVDMKDYKNKFNNIDNYYTVYSQNPYYLLNENGNRFSENRAFGNVQLEGKLLPWLTASFQVGSDVSNSILKTWTSITDNARADSNDDTGNVGESSYSNSELTTNFKLVANKDITEDINVIGILGHNFNEISSRSQSAFVQDLDIPYYYHLSNSSASPAVDELIGKKRIMGVFGSLDLSYKNFMFLNVTARNDWSSTLPVTSRSYFYPSASVSLVFTELMDDKGPLSFGKIRVGVAQTGKDAPMYSLKSSFAQTSLTDGYRTFDFPVTNGSNTVNGFSVGNLIGNNSLQPEISTDIEIGTELKFFENRLGIDVAVYDKTITDLIQGVPLAPSSGFGSQFMNLGKITNKGVELLLTATPIRTKDFEWEVYVNYSKNDNLLVDLYEGLDQISLGGTTTTSYVARPGQPVGLFLGDVVKTDPNGNTVVDNAGLPVFKDEKEIIGNSQNKFRIGGGTSIRYKNFNVRATFDYRNGGKMYSRTAEMMYFTGNSQQSTFNDRQPFIIPNSVLEVTDGVFVENTTPVSGFNNNFNQYYNQSYMAGLGGKYALVDKTFLKIRELSVSYTLPKELLANTFMKTVVVSAVANNVFLWTPNSNLFVDPEATTFGNDIEADYGEYGATPTTRSLGFNVKVAF